MSEVDGVFDDTPTARVMRERYCDSCAVYGMWERLQQFHARRRKEEARKGSRKAGRPEGLGVCFTGVKAAISTEDLEMNVNVEAAGNSSKPYPRG